jgi:Resolvase, N terminal domain
MASTTPWPPPGGDQVFIDKVSGKLPRRPELDRALLVARAGEQLVVTKLDRRWLLVGAWVLVLAQVGATLVAVIAVTQVSDLTFSDRLAEIGDWVVGGTLTLAATAGLVAVQAYAAATGLPDLKFRITLTDSEANQPILLTDMHQRGIVKVRREQLAEGSIALDNLGSYSARNPAVVIRFERMGIAENEYSNDRRLWVPIEHGPLGISAIQWDGGSDYSIHGHSKRVLPINLMSLAWVLSEDQPSLTVELLAEGYTRPPVNVPVCLVTPGMPPPQLGTPPMEWL